MTLRGEDGKYAPGVLLDLDFWVLAFWVLNFWVLNFWVLIPR